MISMTSAVRLGHGDRGGRSGIVRSCDNNNSYGHGGHIDRGHHGGHCGPCRDRGGFADAGRQCGTASRCCPAGRPPAAGSGLICALH